jgi:predicted NAD/FAD-dependent oxidoreductase
MATLEGAKLLQPWTGRFGVAGASGGFLPRESISEALSAGRSKDTDELQTPTTDNGDFCSFLKLANSKSKLYTGTPSFPDMCSGICDLAEIPHRLNSSIKSASFMDNKWLLEIKGGGFTEAFDAVVFATHDPTLASDTIKGLASPDEPRLTALSDALADLRASHKSPVFTLRLTYPRGALARVPFDAATLPADPSLQMLVKESSKPGRDIDGPEEEWTAVSTSMFANIHLPLTEDTMPAVTSTLVSNTNRVLAPYFDNSISSVPAPTSAYVKAWRAAFTTKSLIPAEQGEDCISLAPWRMVVSGDFVSASNSPLEAAAISGLAAGERVAQWFQEQ